MCVDCADYVSAVQSLHCGNTGYPKCINGSITCIPCGDKQPQCTDPGTYAQCGSDGKTSCVPCSNYESVSSTCLAHQFVQCANGNATCQPCQNSPKVKCPFDKYSKCSTDGSAMSCVPCGDYVNAPKCPDNQYNQCMGPSGGEVAKFSCQVCTDFASKHCDDLSTFPICQVSAELTSYQTNCTSLCTNPMSCGTDPNLKVVCDSSGSSPLNKCVYDGPCPKTPPSCDPDQVAVCGSDKQWSCASAPVNVGVVLTQYGLKSYSATDLTGQCKNGPGGTCVVYAKAADSSLFSPVAPTRGVQHDQQK